MSEANIQQMVRMGFGRAEAEAALTQAGNDIMAAISHMVDQPAAPQGGGGDARPFTPPVVGGPEPEPEPGPQERCIQRSQQVVASGGGAGMIDRLRARRDHQEATLAMLREAGAAEDELKVIKADVEVLKRQVADYEENQAAVLRAREAARRAQEQRERERAEQQRAAEAARLAREAEEAEAAEQIRLAADAAARANAEREAAAAAAAAEAQRAAQVEADLARQREADEALANQVQEEMRVAEEAHAAEAAVENALTRSTVNNSWVLDAKTTKDGEDGWFFSATSYTTYDIQVTRPGGTTTVITKRYSDFIDLKSKLAVTEEAKQAEIAKLDFATWTWTKGGSMHEDTINDRKTKLGSWLNAVLFLCPDSKEVVEFIDGEPGLLASMDDPPPVQPQPEPEPEQ